MKDGIIGKYKKDDESRKPSAGMIFQAARDFKIDLKQSFMIGDSTRDILAGKNAGCKTILVLTGNGKEAKKELKEISLEPDFISENILKAIEKILSIKG